MVGAFVRCGICYGDRNYNKIQCFSPHLNGTFVMFMTGEEEQPDEIQLNWRSEELNREVSISDDSYRARRNQLSRYHATLPFQISSQQSKHSVPCATFNFWGSLLRVKDFISVGAACKPCHWQSAVAHLSLFLDRQANIWKGEILLRKISHSQHEGQNFDHRL